MLARSPRPWPLFLAALTSPLVACAPSAPPSHAAIDPGSRLRWGGVTTGFAADLARPGLLGDCIEAGPEGGDRYIEGCRGARPVSGSFVIGSEADVAALCISGDWIVGDLLVDPGPWSRAGLRCIRGVEGRLELDLTDAVGLEGLDRVIRVGELALIGEGEPELTALSGLLSVDAVALEVDTTETLRLAPALADLGDLNVDSPALRFVLPRWPIRSLGSLEVALGGTLLDLDAIGDVEHIDGDVILYRLSQNVDGLQRLEEVEGDLVLSGVLHNTVTSLQRLRRVGGRFELQWDQRVSPQLPVLEEVGGLSLSTRFFGSRPFDWDGFPVLRQVHGDMAISSFRSAALSGFNTLEEVEGGLYLSGVRSGITGLRALRRVGGSLGFARYTAHASPLLPSLLQVGGSVYADDRRGLYTLPGLQELGSITQNRHQRASFSLPAVHTVTGDIRPDRRSTLSFGALERLGGALIIDEDDPLPAGIDALREAGAIEVRTFFPGPIAFPNLERIGRLYVHSPTYGRDFPDLVAIDMPALQEATTIEIGLTEGLGRISMPALHTVTADLTVDGAQEVALLDLDALEVVGGQLWLQHLSSIPELALPRLREVGDDLRFSQSGSLSHLSMPSLERVAGALVLDGNPRLTELAGLDQLRALGGLSFADNDRLEALPALPGLETLEGDLLLDHNLGLEQLSGLSALREVGGALQITGNRSLSLDEIDALIEGLDAAPAGGSTVSGNGR